LLLNIWLPAAAPANSQKWPIYVWLHGGWLQIGNPCHTPRSNPWELVDEAGADLQAIVVAVGHRLNIFGFLAGEGLQGNYGLWVNNPPHIKLSTYQSDIVPFRIKGVL
jgi:carboxylesterase type B